MNAKDLELIRSKLPLSAATIARNTANGVSSDAQPEHRSGHEPVATEARKGTNSIRYSVCLTSYRVRLCDERNLHDKWFTDALIYAGIIPDDSPDTIQIEVKQTQVQSRAYERTEIVVKVIEKIVEKKC